LTNYIPHLGELQSAVMANSNPRSLAGAADAVTGPAPPGGRAETGRADRRGRPTHRP